MLEEDAELWVGLWIDGGLENRQENVLQHFAKVGDKVPASEDVTKIDRGFKKCRFNLSFECISQVFNEWTYICVVFIM